MSADRVPFRIALAMAVVMSSASLAKAEDKTGCHDPAWAPQRAPAFELTSCESWDWRTFDVELPDNTKTLEGRVETSTYTITDESKAPSNETLWKLFLGEGTKSGAKLASNPEGGYSAVMTRKVAGEEVWYVYIHGDGNAEVTNGYTLATIHVTPLKQEVAVQGTVKDWNLKSDPCQDPPWLVKQFATFRRDTCTESDFDEVTVNLPDGDKVLAGHVYRVSYVHTDAPTNETEVGVWRNYVTALKSIGAQLVSREDAPNQALMTRKTPQGQLWYFYRQGGGNDLEVSAYELVYVQSGGPAPKSCTVQLYGVNFDFDKATLRPDSEPVLNEVLSLFQRDASYAGEIGGHTDDVGDKAYNQKLSGERAAAVKDWLTAHGIDASRLTTAGYGDTRPLVPNSSDENRARNRRVELKRTGCTAR